MSSQLLATFNRFLEVEYTVREAVAYVAGLKIEPIPEHSHPHDWRAHVPINLLEHWSELPDDERMAIFVMALSATQPFEWIADGPSSFN